MIVCSFLHCLCCVPQAKKKKNHISPGCQDNVSFGVELKESNSNPEYFTNQFNPNMNSSHSFPCNLVKITFYTTISILKPLSSLSP